MGNRSEVRTIGFDQQAIRRNGSCDLREFAGIGKVTIPEKEIMKAQIKCRSARPALEVKQWSTPRETPAPRGVSVRVSASASRVWMMTGSSHLRSDLQLAAKDLALNFAGRIVVVIIETGFSDREDPGCSDNRSISSKWRSSTFDAS